MIYLQITSGRGPVECEIAIKNIVERIRRDVSGPWLTTVSETKGSVILGFDDQSVTNMTDRSMSGLLLKEYAKTWIGTILWICQSPIRKNHKRKNWFVGIREIQLPENEEILIREQDCAWEVRKASSKGGQHANKAATLVRLTHTPTGITVSAEDQRSQKQNKIIALGRLREALIKRQADAITRLETDNWMQHNELERGNPVRTFEGPVFVERG
jgi:peptide chain release factor